MPICLMNTSCARSSIKSDHEKSKEQITDSFWCPLNKDSINTTVPLWKMLIKASSFIWRKVSDPMSRQFDCLPFWFFTVAFGNEGTKTSCTNSNIVPAHSSPTTLYQAEVWPYSLLFYLIAFYLASCKNPSISFHFVELRTIKEINGSPLNGYSKYWFDLKG